MTPACREPSLRRLCGEVLPRVGLVSSLHPSGVETQIPFDGWRQFRSEPTAKEAIVY